MKQLGIFEFYLENYKVPSEVKALENAISRQIKVNDSKTEFYWYYSDEKANVKYEKVINSTLADKYLSSKTKMKKGSSKMTLHDEARTNKIEAFRNIDKPLITYGMQTIMTRYVIVDSLEPLRIYSYNHNIVSFIRGPFFAMSKNKPEESIYYSNF
jgi:hypothetical protein